jgi:DNA-binding transcriptional MerR regulator
MQNNIFTLQEILDFTETGEQEFLEWQKAGLIEPVGHSEEHAAYFSGKTVERIKHIKQFTQMGYSTEEIRKILRKVGIPAAKKGGKTDGPEREQLLTIGALAEQAGISPRTIKHWEEKGIIEPDMRSQGGFRLYKDYYVFFCKLIQDLQLFGYSLDEIKRISDFFRDFVAIRTDQDTQHPEEIRQRLSAMQAEIDRLFEKTSQLKEGISRWEELLRKHRKQIINLQNKNSKKVAEGTE